MEVNPAVSGISNFDKGERSKGVLGMIVELAALKDSV